MTMMNAPWDDTIVRRNWSVSTQRAPLGVQGRHGQPAQRPRRRRRQGVPQQFCRHHDLHSPITAQLTGRHQQRRKLIIPLVMLVLRGTMLVLVLVSDGILRF